MKDGLDHYQHTLERRPTMFRLYTLALVLFLCSGGCGDQKDPFASASHRLQRTQLKRDIAELEQLRRQYPYQVQIHSELRRMKKKLKEVEIALDLHPSKKK